MTDLPIATSPYLNKPLRTIEEVWHERLKHLCGPPKLPWWHRNFMDPRSGRECLCDADFHPPHEGCRYRGPE